MSIKSKKYKTRTIHLSTFRLKVNKYLLISKCYFTFPSTSIWPIHRRMTKVDGISAPVLVVTAVRSGLTYSFGVFIVELNKEFARHISEYSTITI